MVRESADFPEKVVRAWLLIRAKDAQNAERIK